MPTIEKKTNFFRKNINYIFVAFWLLMSISMFFLSEDKNNFNQIISGLYLVISAGYVFLAFKYRDFNEEFIFWNSDQLIIGRLHQKPLIYELSNVHQILVNKEHLTVKAPKATGIMLNLKGFDEADIEKLKASFSRQ
jgi:hypothetical protein